MDKGFYEGFRVVSKVDFDADELLDLILTRYKNLDFLEQLDVYQAFDLFNKAILKREENKLWQLYLVNFGRMDEESFYSFEEYKKKAKFNDKPEESDNLEDFESHETVEETFNRLKAKIGMK